VIPAARAQLVELLIAARARRPRAIRRWHPRWELDTLERRAAPDLEDWIATRLGRASSEDVAVPELDGRHLCWRSCSV